jgi:hypothetical protein
MAKRRGTPKRNVEEMIARFHGINRKGDVVNISVYKKGGDVRLSGPNGSHPVHRSNIGNMEGWIREAALVWGLSDIIDIPTLLLNSPDTKEKLKHLNMKAKKLREKQEGAN